MVNIPIDDCNTLHPEARHPRLACYGYRVEQAEATARCINTTTGYCA